MTATNHAVTGALVAVAIKQPAIALPAAFFSHFVIDAIPHWDYKLEHRYKQLALTIDLTIALSILLFLSVTVTASQSLIIAGGLLGILPDFIWAPYLITGKPSRVDKKTPLHLTRRFHFWVQWSETRNGIYFEIFWFVLMLTLLFHIQR